MLVEENVLNFFSALFVPCTLFAYINKIISAEDSSDKDWILHNVLLISKKGNHYIDK